MKLTGLKLQNFRCFDSLAVELDERLTVLVAPNGQGKTTVLDAIRIALWPYVSAFDVVSGTMPGSGIDIDDVRVRPTRQASPRTMEPRLPCVVSALAVIAGETVSWSRSREKVSAGSKTTVREAKPLMEVGFAYQARIRLIDEYDSEKTKDVTLPLVAYYGTGRLWKRRKVTLKRESNINIFSRTSAYLGCLDSASDYGSFLEWFFFLYAADFEQKTKTLERNGFHGLVDDGTPYGDILTAISGSVDLVMSQSGWSQLRYSPANQTLIMSHAELGDMKVDQLSDGQRNLIAMAGDIAYRCVRLNPHLARDATRQTEGIVLIDEIDMHLHPQWQQTVVDSFQRAFPRIQFILTTHSPQVISTVPVESIRILGQNLDRPAIPSEETRGIASSSVLSSIFGTDPIPNVPEADWRSRYLAQIQQGIHDSPDGLELREKLIQHFGKNHPVIRDADRMIRLEEFKRRLPLPATRSEG